MRDNQIFKMDMDPILKPHDLLLLADPFNPLLQGLENNARRYPPNLIEEYRETRMNWSSTN